MSQQTYFVNCPKCAHLFEVVCPRPNSDVERVTAIPENSTYFSGRSYEDIIKIPCPGCQAGLKTIWQYSREESPF